MPMSQVLGSQFCVFDPSGDLLIKFVELRPSEEAVGRTVLVRMRDRDGEWL